MKKIISAMIAIFLVLSVFITSVSAVDDTLTRDEAILIVQDAYRMMRVCQNGYLPIDTSKFSGSEMFYKSSKNGTIVINESVDGEKYYKPQVYVKAVPYEGYEEYAKLETIYNKTSKVFSKDMTERMLKIRLNTEYYPENSFIDSYRENEDSVLFVSPETGEPMQYPYFLHEYNMFESSGNTAKMVITLRIRTHVVGDPTLYPQETVEFTKTSDGWRVSGGTAFEVMLGDREPNSNPNTGDTSSVIVPALTVTALISVALPVGIMRKRRRFA